MTSRRASVAMAAILVLAGLVCWPAGTARAATCTITTTLRLGMRSGQVACLEARLRELGHTDVRGPDPVFGLSTRAAVLAFQRASGLAVDGVVGPLTRAALGLRAPLPPPGPTVAPAVVETRVIGASVQGRDIIAVRLGTPGGRVVLLVGIIHGDEVKGAEITKLVRTLPIPAGIDLWIVDSMNPDGVANGTRGNAHGVDLNRNFETGWSYIPRSTTHRQYSGEAAADQPETQALQAFIGEIQPQVGIWYHQDANVISAGGARKEIPLRYGELVGLGAGDVPCSQRCTGTAGKFANTAVPNSTNFLVELPGSAVVTAALVRTHARAVLAVVTIAR